MLSHRSSAVHGTGGQARGLENYFSRIEGPAPTAAALGLRLREIVSAGLGSLPLPGSGETLYRWRCLSQVAGRDLGLAKLYEGQTDALAILAELGADNVEIPPESTWGMWAAEPPYARVTATPHGQGRIELHGRKAWCSGAPVLSHALLTARNAEGEQCLAALALDQAGVGITDNGWEAVGMAATASVEVEFEGALATAVGGPGDYVHRAGFWQGGAGIVACWHGAAVALADRLGAKAGDRGDPFLLAHLGAVDAALSAAAATLRETAAWIDAHPRVEAAAPALRARAVVENSVERTIRHTGRALGATPFCRDPHFARLMADLPVFMRQSHAERDLETLGKALPKPMPDHWAL